MKKSSGTPPTIEKWVGPAIILLDLDAFFASVEQLDHPSWRGKPVIVGGDADKRGVVSTASYEARAFGVHSAMPASTAARLCPQAIWTHGHFDRYRELSAAVMSIMYDESPFLQQVSIDEAFLDITPTPHNTEDPVVIASRIQKRVNALGITCSIGLGCSKAVAKVASDYDKPCGLTVVYPGREQAFLRDLPTKVMSGIGAKAQEALRQANICTLGQVAAADDMILQRVFGKNAQMMRDRCLGKDTAVISQPQQVKSVSNEISFAEDLTDRADIEASISALCAKVARRLRKKSLHAGTVTLKVRYENRSLRTAQVALDTPIDTEFALRKAVQPLIDKLWSPGMRLRLIGVATSHFDRKPVTQQALFAADDSPSTKKRDESLSLATDKVRDRFGEDALKLGSQIRTGANVTGTGAKNPDDYL